MPSECAGIVPVAARSASSRVDQRPVRRPRSRAGPARDRTAATGPLAWSGTAVARCRTAAHRRAPARPTRPASAASRSGWAKVAVSMTMPAIRTVGQIAPLAGVERRRRGGPRASATISQVAAAAGSTQSASAAPSLEAWWSMTTRGRRVEQLGMPHAHGADPVQRPAVGDHEQVVVGRRGPDRSGTARSPAGSRRAAGPGRCTRGRAWPPSASTSRDDRERRAERVRVGVLVADRQDAPSRPKAVHDHVRDRREARRQVDGHQRLARPSSAPPASRASRLGRDHGRRRLDRRDRLRDGAAERASGASRRAAGPRRRRRPPRTR